MSLPSSFINTIIDKTIYSTYVCDLSLWHKSLAHASILVVNKSLQTFNVFFSNNKAIDFPCNVYPLGKFHELHFCSSKN